MQEKLLKETIENTQKTIEKDTKWKDAFKNYVEVLLENREMLKQFYKSCKDQDPLQFCISEIITTGEPTLFKILMKYDGQAIADIILSKDNEVQITTEKYDASNKKDFGCSLQLRGEKWSSIQVGQFMNYFKGEIERKNKGNEKARIESMLLSEFSKTSSVDKLLIGIQPILQQGLFFKMPVIIGTEEPTNIDILARTKVRRITIFEVKDESVSNETIDKVLIKATQKAVFMLNLLNTDYGAKWYKAMGFSGRLPSNITIKVCIAISKKSNVKATEVNEIELKCGNDTIKYCYMNYEQGKDKIISIETNVNE